MGTVRSTRVVRGGGMFHLPRPTYSKETQAMLKVLMEESRLTIIQRKMLQDSIKRGDSLPVPPSENVRDLVNSSRAVSTAMYRNRCCKRSHDAIIRSGAYEREKFVPMHPKVDRTVEKQKFQSLMAYGKVLPASPRVKGRPRKFAEPLRTPNYDERFDELVQEVKDRVDFLVEMRDLGQESKYRTIIQQEIADKIRQMKAIDKQKCIELNELLEKCRLNPELPKKEIGCLP